MEHAPGKVREYFEQFLPRYQGLSLVEGLAGIDCSLRFVVTSPNGEAQSWLTILRDGGISAIAEGGSALADFEYHTDVSTFLLVVCGRMSCEQAFFQRLVSIHGDLLKGLKMAAMLQPFFSRLPFNADDMPHEALSYEAPGPGDDPMPVSGIVEEIVQYDLKGRESTLKVSYPEEGATIWHVLMAPPHPFLGATMDNQVFQCLSRRLAALGCLTVRFNYEETDLSSPTASRSGMADEARSFWDRSSAGYEFGLEPTRAAWTWMKSLSFQPSRGQVALGYSFGAQTILRALPGLAPDRLILLSPVASQIGEEIRQASPHTLLVSAGQDFATTPSEYDLLHHSIPPRKAWENLPDADHFYTGHLHELSLAIEAFLGLSDSPHD